MKTKYILKGLLASIILAFGVSSCDSYGVDVVDELMFNRVFAPVNLKVFVRNQTNAELNWDVKTGIDHYVVEFSADDATFGTIFKSVEVKPEKLPVTIALEGETVYSIRVKGVSSTGLEDSKWSFATATTLTEQILLPSIPNDLY